MNENNNTFKNTNELLTPQNSALVLIDHQPFVTLQVRSHEVGEIVRAATALAKAAKTMQIPTVLTTIGAKISPLADPIFSEIQAVFPDVDPIDRTNTNAWSNDRVVEAVKQTGRKKLVMAGIWTGVCLAQTALSAIKDGYEVYFVTNASGDVSVEAHQDAKARLIQAGAHPITATQVIGEWSPDMFGPERQAIYEVAIGQKNIVGMMFGYALEQVNTGRVKMPAYGTPPNA